EELTFLDLPWEDVIFRYILPCLPLQTQFQLRRVSLGFRDLMTAYFSTAKSVNITRIALRMTAGAFEILTQHNNSLQNIVLRNAKDWLTDKILNSVLSRNPKLVKLDLTNCSSVSNTCLQILASKCPNMRDISLRECHWVSREGVTVIALHCRDLQCLDLTGCWEVDDEAVMMVALSCKKLRFLSLAKIYGMTDNALSVVAREATSLVHLNIQGCWRLSDDSMHIVAEYAQSLQALQVRECRDVTERTLSKLRQRGVKTDVRPPPSLRAMSDVSLRLRSVPNIQM
ncbi:hypothetical protein FSP39_008052, partial [Pinctada imbricata]